MTGEPTAPYALAKELDLLVTGHLNSVPTLQRVPEAVLLHRGGLLGPRQVYSHANTSSDEELALPAAAGAAVTCTPESEAQMGIGFPVLGRARAADRPLAAARAFFDITLERIADPGLPDGCLVAQTVMAIPVLSASVAARAREAIGFQHTRLRAALKAGRLHDEAAESFATPKADFAIVPARPLTGTAPAGPAIRSVWRATSEALSSPRVPHSWPGSTSMHRTHLCTRLRRPYRDGGRIGTVTDPLLMAFGTMSV
ncbi:hypothetical protein [Streptomyces antimycoticus]